MFVPCYICVYSRQDESVPSGWSVRGHIYNQNTLDNINDERNDPNKPAPSDPPFSCDLLASSGHMMPKRFISGDRN